MKTAQRESHRRWALAFQKARRKWKKANPFEATAKRLADLADRERRARLRIDRTAASRANLAAKRIRREQRNAERRKPVSVNGALPRIARAIDTPRVTIREKLLSIFHRQKLRKATP